MTPDDIRHTAEGFRQAQVILTCVELGVFDALATGSKTAAELAATVGADPRAIELLLNAATAMGLVGKVDGQFSNAAVTSETLVSGAVGSIAPALRLQAGFYRRWANLADAVRSGTRPEENTRDEDPDTWIEGFVTGLYTMAVPVAPAVAAAVPLPADRPLRLLDVGGCHGAYAMAFASLHRGLRATVYELPRVVPHAERIVAEAGMSDRVAFEVGDFRTGDLGSGYDVALVFGVLNGEPPELRPRLIEKVFDALAPGGTIVLRDAVLTPDRTGPPDATIFALQMLLATDSGGLDTWEDWERWLTGAGFVDVAELEVADVSWSTFMLARRPR